MPPDTKVCELHSGIEARIEAREKDDSDQWIAIHQLQNRLPVWATLLISVLTFLLGCAVTLAIHK